MKTILVPIFHPLDSRNFLQTDVFRVLKSQKNILLVLLVPEDKGEYYTKNFSSKNVVVESIGQITESFLASRLRKITRMTFSSGSMFWQAKIDLANHHNFGRYLMWRFLSFFGRFRFIRFSLRVLFSWLVGSNVFDDIVEKYSPDLIFQTDIYSTPNVYLGLAGRKKKVKTIGLVRSWDNLTSKGVCLFIPDKVVVHNLKLKEDCQKILKVDEENIKVVGLPHFDLYFEYKPSVRETFLKKVGLPSDSRFILFAPYWGTYTKAVNEILAMLSQAIEDKKLDLKILLRMPPSYRPGFVSVYESDHIVVDYPGEKLSASRKGDWEFSLKDMDHLADSIIHSVVVLNFASTITIDAAALDKPVINIGFDGLDKKRFTESIKDIYVVDHFKSILESGGSPLSESLPDLLEKINDYAHNPGLDSAGRHRMVSEQCWKLDGQSGQRLANYLINEA